MMLIAVTKLTIVFLSVTGYFAYIDPDSPRLSGDTAVIYNPEFVATPAGQCLRFWYHMHHDGVGSIAVHKYSVSDGTLGDQLWMKRGDQDDVWRFVSVTLQSNADQWAVSLV